MTMKTKEKSAEPSLRGRRSKSPARSPARSRSRSKSPARTPQRTSGASNDRAEPAVRRSQKSESAVAVETNTRALRKSDAATAVPVKNETPQKSTITVTEVKSSRRTVEKLLPEEIPLRQSSRIAAIKSVQETTSVLTERKVHSSTSKVAEDVVDSGKKTKKPFQLSIVWTITWNVLVVVCMVALALGAVMACNLKSCALNKLPTCSHVLSDYIDLESALMILGWLLLQFLLAFVPIGPLRFGEPFPNGTQLQYRCNGLFSLLVTGSLLAAAYYFKFGVFEMVSRHFVQLAVVSLLTSLAVGLCCYVKARRLPAELLCPKTGCVFCDFVVGRELNPRCCRYVDLKMFCAINVATLGWAVLAAVTVVKAYDTNKLYGGFAVTAAFQSIYVLGVLIFQPSLVNSLLVNHDGFGLTSALYTFVLFPFINSIQLRYLLLNPQTLSCTTISVLSAIFFVGFVMNRWSVYVKDKFRQNQHDPRFSAYLTIPTIDGKPLLASGLWGWCRHPNYLGFVIMAAVWSYPCGVTCPLTYVYPLLALLLLIHRANRDGVACQAKHGSAAWNRYCQRVRSRIIPYVC